MRKGKCQETVRYGHINTEMVNNDNLQVNKYHLCDYIHLCRSFPYNYILEDKFNYNFFSKHAEHGMVFYASNNNNK